MQEMIEQPVHGLESKPKLPLAFLVAFQNVVKFSLLLSYTIIIGGMLNLDITNLVSISLLGSAIATFLMTLKKPIGGHCFIPTRGSVPYFASMVVMAKLGSAALFFSAGMFIGILQCVWSVIFSILKPVFTRRLTGIISYCLGLWAAVIGVNEIFRPDSLGQIMIHGSFLSASPIDPKACFSGFITLVMLMIFRSIPKTRSLCILYAMLIGWFIGAVLQDIPEKYLQLVVHAPWFAWPHFAWHFSLALGKKAWFLLACVSLYGALEYYGLLSIIDTANHKPHFSVKRSIKGNCAAGLGVFISSAIGGVPQSPIPGSPGDMLLTGTYSRFFAYPYALIMFAMAFLPKVALFFITIPAGVNGAVIIMMGAWLLKHGFILLDFDATSDKLKKALGFTLSLASITNIVPEFYNSSYTNWVTNPTLLVGIVIFFLSTSLFMLGGRRERQAA